MSSPSEAALPSRRIARRDYRWPVLIVLIAAIVGLGYAFSLMPGRGVVGSTAKQSEPFGSLAAAPRPASVQRTAESEEEDGGSDHHAAPTRQALDEAQRLIEGGRYEEALSSLNVVRPLVQRDARAYLLVGRALEGQRDYQTARDFYGAAIDRDPFLAEAYWGVATTSEALGELEAALGAMRSYLHTEPDKDPHRLRVAQARSAIWEWEAQLGRGPWGPTRGIPPGFTAEDIKRDGRGVAIRMPVPGSEQPDGRLLAEIRHADKKEIFQRP